MVVRYAVPERWIRYDPLAVVNELIDAKAAVLALTSIPYQRSWAEALQAIELKREIAGTSKIEGAEFTERELNAALDEKTPEETLNRSQRQARAAKATYGWIAGLAADQPIDEMLIKRVHAHVVTGCDDDRCAPGQLRGGDDNVTFGSPRHRGAEGGAECKMAFDRLCAAVRGEFRGHDLFVQGLALHYHLGAMHPFGDGNGRTARALEALYLQRAGLKDDLFVAMSNYYYDEKQAYLATLSEARAEDHDLTPFLKFGLRGVAFQCRRLLGDIKTEISMSLFRDVMTRMYGLLMSTKKRALALRQIAILQLLLEGGPLNPVELVERVKPHYDGLRAPRRALIRDLAHLLWLKAIEAKIHGETIGYHVRLKWATEITETRFYELLKKMPEAKTYRGLFAKV